MTGPHPDASRTGARTRALLASGALDLPRIGRGATPDRWRALADLARNDVSVARLAEAHVDAVQILAEAGRDAPEGQLLGVWAAKGPDGPVRARPHRDGGLELEGRKAFAGGASLVDAALVTVARDGTHVLLLVPLDGVDEGRLDRRGWVTPALADTDTAVVDLGGVRVADGAVVGGDRWYLDRPGFWHGAVGPAACWAGAAHGLVDHVEGAVGDEPHARAHLGAMRAEAYGMAAALEQAGRGCDDRPGDAEAARARALAVRHLVDRAAGEVQDRLARALGPRPLVGDAAVVARDAALRVYRRQCHAERDLEALGRATRPGDDVGRWM